MDLDSDIEIAIGPYEVYEDGLFNFKAVVRVLRHRARQGRERAPRRVRAAPARTWSGTFRSRTQHKNFTRKFESPIGVVQEVFTAGDARRGVQTAAFNLPNDEKVREAKGSKKVLLKNVMEAKFEQSGRPVAERVLDPSQTGEGRVRSLLQPHALPRALARPRPRRDHGPGRASASRRGSC